MDIIMLALTAICAVGGIISSVPVVSGWVHTRHGGAVVTAAGPSNKKWGIVLGLSLFAFIFSGTGFYRTEYPDVEVWQSPRQQTIYAKSYINETVELDGKIFDHCNFENVKLLYHGLGPVSFIQGTFKGQIWVGSDNLAIRNFGIADAALEKLTPLIRLNSWIEMDM